jgi:hypothetical protein
MRDRAIRLLLIALLTFGAAACTQGGGSGSSAPSGSAAPAAGSPAPADSGGMYGSDDY